MCRSIWRDRLDWGCIVTGLGFWWWFRVRWIWIRFRLDLDFLDSVGQPEWYVLGVSIEVDMYDMVSGNDSWHVSCCFVLFLCLWHFGIFVLISFRTMWQAYMSSSEHLEESSCLVPCRFRGLSSRILVLFLIVEGMVLMEIGCPGTKHGQVLVWFLRIRWLAKNVTHGQGDKVETGDQADNYNCEH